ncbi:type II toxin-antitoxin system YhaV family toxin [Alteromonas sp. IB21]|uniref:type II toxin-antitoxin system YhaV family toxin n=1 Tax=Alteromonas sp. IB21 TaxID=2779369 RepID=UPI0018E88842|nr:type II toxin-antitoxin system YhaV family toxin [Alteromonas sp. IB21]MBJ2128630.1 type II toxin-antitoxin system YhaV family toxin [Alteromonas sp. IB21]
MQKTIPAVVNGWTLYAHPLFIEQYLNLKSQVEALREKDPKNYTKKNAAKRLAAIQRLTFELIPHDPTHADFRQGNTLGDDNKHWFRAKFFQQYRLFFRYHLESKVIVYAWVNDEKNKRAYGSKTDAYRVFEKMVKSGHPPKEWEDLLKAAQNTLPPL